MDADRIAGEGAGRPPNVDAFLMTIRKCEGTDTPIGYQALFGYHPRLRPDRIFDNGFAAHPNYKFNFTQTDGTINYTTAAGAYQFLYRTWLDVAAKIGAPDFSPEWQDAGAVERIRQRSAYDDVVAGRLQAAIDKCSAEWASLPASSYPQPKRTYAFAKAEFENAGGVVA